MKTPIRCVCVVLFALCASEARAEGWVAPFIGVNFGGDASGRFDEIANERQPLTLGLGIGGMSEGVLGVELDFAYSNRFFGKKTLVSANHVMTIVPTLLVAAPGGSDPNHEVRPYLELGVGWLQRKLRVDDVDIYANENDLALTLGGGIIGFFGEHVGLRGDFRYLRAFGNDDVERLPFAIENRHFGFARFAIGTVLRF